MYHSNGHTTVNQPNSVFIHRGDSIGTVSGVAIDGKSEIEGCTTTLNMTVAAAAKDSSTNCTSNSATTLTGRVAPTNTGSDHAPSSSSSHQHHSHPQQQYAGGTGLTLAEEVWASTDLIFKGKATWLLALGPVAVMGDIFGGLPEATCFICSGIALIPCAKRLSFVTEQVALHTNGTIGALLNATFGNAPELLISIAALRSGFYRVVQLAMLGSMITNMMFVFGVSCLIGGLRWQVQTIRQVSGNVSVGMLLVATAGSLIPATLILSGQFQHRNHNGQSIVTATTAANSATQSDAPTQEEVTLSRVNAAVMLILYLCYIVFQLGTHKDEFDEALPDRSGRGVSAPPNVFCRFWCSRAAALQMTSLSMVPDGNGHYNSNNIAAAAATTTTLSSLQRGIKKRTSSRLTQDDVETLHQMTTTLPVLEDHSSVNGDESYTEYDEEDGLFFHGTEQPPLDDLMGDNSLDRIMTATSERRRRRRGGKPERTAARVTMDPSISQQQQPMKKTNGGGIHHHGLVSLQTARMAEEQQSSTFKHSSDDDDHVPLISMRVGIVWLFIITFCVSAMSDILVDTIDGFAQRMQLSQVFTSMVIIPFFSNVAEQVTAFIFAYRNEMDLVVGVTIGSAIQIATFVLPGSVLIGMVMDRSMTLYFHSYETVCLLLCTLIVAAVLQGGTTNWMVGAMLIGVYTMFAAGIWFHEIENLSVNLEPIEG